MFVSVIGAGYVGLVTAVGLSCLGHDVSCFESDSKKLVDLQSGKLTFFEPGLDENLKKQIESNKISFKSEFYQADFDKSQMLIIAIGTPQLENGEPDMNNINSFLQRVCKFSVKEDKVIVLKSTVPIGTGDSIKNNLFPDDKIHVVNNPEFLREGTALGDFFNQNRIIIGCDLNDGYAFEIMEELYYNLKSKSPILRMDRCSAELSKYAANAMIASRISFMNDMSEISEAFGANIDSVRASMGYDDRIGPSYLNPGAGFGGSCFTKDVNALIQLSKKKCVRHPMLSAILDSNYMQKRVPLRKIKKSIGFDLKGKKITILGLAFKPKTDDMRDAPSLVLIHDLIDHNAKITVHDPKAMDNAYSILGNKVNYGDINDYYHSFIGTDAIVLMTEWDEYKCMDVKKIKILCPKAVFIDMRNCMDENEFRKNSIQYIKVG